MLYFGPKKHPVLLLESGALQVFCMQTQREYIKKREPKELFWCEKNKSEIYGPFTSLYQACSHYTYLITQKKIKNKLIYVDFKNKYRI